MQFKVDLKIFLFLILYYYTRQIETYVTIIIFAVFHEFGHLLAGLAMGMKPGKIELMPYGLSISFKLKPDDYNKAILKGNLLVIKKILVALAGPITNLIIIFIVMNINRNILANPTIIYANLLLIFFNLMPIYPLDGGKILKGILHMILGKKKSERYINLFSFIILIIITFIASITIFYLENVSVFLITVFLWGIYIKQDMVFRRRNKIYDLIEKTIEIQENK